MCKQHTQRARKRERTFRYGFKYADKNEKKFNSIVRVCIYIQRWRRKHSLVSWTAADGAGAGASASAVALQYLLAGNHHFFLFLYSTSWSTLCAPLEWNELSLLVFMLLLLFFCCWFVPLWHEKKNSPTEIMKRIKKLNQRSSSLVTLLFLTHN